MKSLNSADFIRNHLIDKVNKNTIKKVIQPFQASSPETSHEDRAYPDDLQETDLSLDSDKLIQLYGKFSAEVVHEIRNPLTAIKGFTQILSEENVTVYKEVLLDEINRIERIVNNLLVLGKTQQPQEWIKVNIKEVVRNVVLLLKPLASQSKVSIIEKYPLEDLFVNGEGDKLKQLFINIIKNSLEAMINGGTITICLQPNKNKMKLLFHDNGIGIPNNQLNKIGEPYFSTKEKGTGIGIMICKKIVKDHGGSMLISSEENKGTTVTIQLPLAI